MATTNIQIACPSNGRQKAPRMKKGSAILCATYLIVALAFCCGAGKQAKSRPGGNLDYWLSRAKPLDTQPAATTQPARPITITKPPKREDALPGVIQLSDGTLLAGSLYTTRGHNWQLYIESQKRWRQIPLITVLSIAAIVREEKMVQQWRWKAMGTPERVYTGREYPTRRLKWSFHLIDGSRLIGTIKGQPLWLEQNGKTFGPFVLHERSKGQLGQKLSELIYIKKLYVSRRLAEAVLADRAKPPAGSD
ncbi:MAG: hypothetical protein SVT52_08780 [Planctomycetota bacterium]|nr:hypothetical protein [Planctomycetota bacterium]